MADRDKFGNFVNNKGVIIKISTDKNGGDHISFYGSDVDKPHDGIHINIDYNKGTWTSTTHNADKSDTDSSSGFCYLTTACMKHYLNNFDDNCYELTVLRWFRDNFVSEEDIKHYYNTAPYIVCGIEKEDNKDIVYNYIYDNVVDYCVTAIENGNYMEAYKRYKNSILSLEELYAKKELGRRLIKTLS